jgi:hypothetical protein
MKRTALTIIVLALTANPVAAVSTADANQVAPVELAITVAGPVHTVALPEPPAEFGLTIVGGTPEQVALVAEAVDRFESVGMDLPAADIYLHGSRSSCTSYRYQGVFNLDGSTRRVDICNAKLITVVHELAHLWEHHNVSDDVRQALMDLNGAVEWQSLDVDWDERGIEIAAETIAKGLIEQPMVRAQLEDAPLLAESFRLITGVDSPRFADAVSRIEAGRP